MTAIDMSTLKAGDLVRATRDAYSAAAALPTLKAGTVWEVALVCIGHFHLKDETGRCFKVDDFEQVWPGETAKVGDTIELTEDVGCYMSATSVDQKGSQWTVDRIYMHGDASWIASNCSWRTIHNHRTKASECVVVERAPEPTPKPNARDAKVGDLVRPLEDFSQDGESFRRDTLYLVYASYFLATIGVRTSTRPRGTYANADKFEIVVRAVPKLEPKPEPAPCKHETTTRRLDDNSYDVYNVCDDCGKKVILASYASGATLYEMTDRALRTHGLRALGGNFHAAWSGTGLYPAIIRDAQDYADTLKAAKS